ncbi:MAG: hypothetical protein QXT68_00435 [Halobacteria archaeon]
MALETVTLSLPKKEVEVLLKVLDDIRFLEKVERGERQVRAGKYLTVEEFRRKHLRQRQNRRS